MAEVLRELRARRSETQAAVSEETGIDVAGLERMEREPVLSVLWRLAEAYRTTPSRLVMAIDKRYRRLRTEGGPEARASDLKELDHLREISATSPVPTWVASGDQICIHANQAMLDYTGRPLEELLGRGWMGLIHPEDVEKRHPSIAKAWKRREAYSHQYRFRRADGEYQWVAQMAVSYFTRRGVFVGYVGSLIPLSDEDRERIILLQAKHKPKA
jgi:PAS domain S-box-containing protein